ncbi:hypothetical protein SAMN05444000_1461 [Shimia gijangensis]|uniref:Uncharacterized protein n=1 Tax=Shimia gijangensis TaxID=1470563 RepID=A0A1M6TW66_9RHOB|nr:hypothetical protein SAMN05444000_1461 [Shimia gijangensis]
MGAVAAGIETDRGYPITDEPSILSGGQVKPVGEPTWQLASPPVQARAANLIPVGTTPIFSCLKLHRSVGLALDHGDEIASPIKEQYLSIIAHKGSFIVNKIVTSLQHWPIEWSDA